MSFNIVRQDLKIDNVNFSEQSFEGITKFYIWPTDRNLKTIILNCNGPQISNIFISKIESHNELIHANYNTLDDEFISIHIPKEFDSYIQSLQCLSVIIYFKSVGNKCGLQFVISPTGTLGDYMYCAPYNNCTGSTFPCVEFNQACEWFIEIVIPKQRMVAISNGNLISKDDDVYLFHLSRKTTARNISFVIGEFEFLVDDKNPQFGYYCPPQDLIYLKITTKPIEEIYSFLKSNIRMNYPYNNYKAVFVAYLLEDHYTSSSMTLFNINTLHNEKIIEQMFLTRQILSIGLCEQYFGAFIEPKQWNDSWICWGLSEHLSWLFVKDAFGDEREEQSIYEIKENMDLLIDYETKNDGIILDPSFCKPEMPFDLFNPKKMPMRYKKFYRIKAGLVIRSCILSYSLRGICRILNFYLQLEKFIDFTMIDKLSLGRWRSSVEYLVKKQGHMNITAKAHYHARQKVIELVVGQTKYNSSFLYNGCIDVEIQEPDGLFNRVVQVKSEIINRIEIATCSKISHLRTGQKLITRDREKIDGPILGWVLLDQEMKLIGKITNIITEEQAKLIIRHESKFWAKYCGLIVLESYRNDDHFQWLMRQICRRRVSIIIRLECIRQLRNALYDPLTTFPRDSMKKLLVTLFCEKDEINPVLKKNCWRYVGDYLIHMKLIETLSVTYEPDSFEKWSELLLLYVNMLDANEYFTDLSVSNFRANIITAMSNGFVTVSRLFIQENLGMFIDILNKQLVVDMAVPSHNYCVTAAVLCSFAQLEQNGLFRISVTLYLSFDYDDNEYVRLAGISALLTFLNNIEKASEPLEEIISYLSQSEVPATIRCKALNLLSEKLISLKSSQKHIYPLEKLTNLMNKHRNRIMELSNENSPPSLRACANDLLYIVNCLTTPFVELQSQFLLESLEKPMMNDINNDATSVAHYLGTYDDN